MEMLIVLGILLLPATVAYFTHHVPSALTIAFVLGGYCLLMGLRLWELSHAGMGCGMGLGVARMCLFGSGFCFLTTLWAARMIYVKSRPAPPTDVGFTPER